MNESRHCTAGHLLAAEHRFCPVCGAAEAAVTGSAVAAGPDSGAAGAAAGAAEEAAAEAAAVRPDPAARPAGWVHKPWVWLGAAALAIGVSAAIAVAGDSGAGASGPAARADSSTVSTTRTMPTDPHSTCVRQLVATTTDVHDNGTAGVTREMTINGQSDPYVQAAMMLSEQFTADSYQVGAKTAMQRVFAAAETTCSGDLGDTIRPNYPTDGSFPSY